MIVYVTEITSKYCPISFFRYNGDFSMAIFMIIRETDSLFSVSFLEAIFIYGVTEGIKDPSIFNVPAVCKSEEHTVHVSHVLIG